MTTKYHDVNNEVKIEGQKTVKVKYGDFEKQLPLMISSRENFTQLLSSKWFDNLNFELRTNQIAALKTMDESAQGIKNKFYTKYRKLLQYNKTIKGVKVEMTRFNRITKTRPISVRGGVERNKAPSKGRRRREKLLENMFISPAVITMKR